MPLQVTADSNVYISALVFAGRPLQLLDAARAGVFRLAVSDAILAEVQRVLRDKFRWPREDLDEVAAALADFTVRVHPDQTIDAVPQDPDDNRVWNARSPQARTTSSPATATCCGSASTAAFGSCVWPTSCS